MTDNIAMDPGALRDAAIGVDRVGGDIGTVARTVAEALTLLKDACGTDKFGRQFTDGDDGFESASTSMVEATSNVAITLGSIAEGQFAAADALESAEGVSTRGLS